MRGDWIGHEGQLIGWESIAMYNPSTGAAFVILTNSSGSLWDAKAVINEYYPDAAGLYTPTEDEIAAAVNTPVPTPSGS